MGVKAHSFCRYDDLAHSLEEAAIAYFLHGLFALSLLHFMPFTFSQDSKASFKKPSLKLRA